MPRNSSATGVATASLVAIVAIASVQAAAAQQPTRVRSISYSVNQPIADRLLPDDEVVVIKRYFDTVTFEPAEPTITQLMELAVKSADIVAVVDIRDVVGVLVEDGKWVHTRLTGTAREVLKSPTTRPMVRGAPAVIEIDSGEIMIGKVLVKAGDVIAFPSRRRYLMFLRANRDTGVLQPVLTPLPIENGKLVSLPPGGAAADKFHGSRLSDVVRQVRRVPQTR